MATDSFIPITYYSDINLFYAQEGNTKQLYITNIDAVAVKIVHILGTNKGSYEFEPLFGSDLPNLLWEPMDDTTAWYLRTATIEALNTWLPIIQIDISNTLFTPNEDDYSYTANIAYTVLATNQYSVLSLNVPANQ